MIPRRLAPRTATTAAIEPETGPCPGQCSPRLWLLLYHGIAVKLVTDWYELPDFSHGFLIPFFAAFLLWDKRRRIRRTPIAPSWAGSSLVILGLFELLLGSVRRRPFPPAHFVCPAGCRPDLDSAGQGDAGPVEVCAVRLLLAIPLPTILFNQITFPLQIAGFALGQPDSCSWSRFRCCATAISFNLPAMPLEVAEACSGIRSLMSLFTVAVIYGYFLERKTWRRVVLALSSLPIAVAANVARIFGTGLCVQYWDPEKALGFFHEFSGWLMFLVSLAVSILCIWRCAWCAERQASGMRSPRLWLVVLLMSFTALVLHVRGDVGPGPAQPPAERAADPQSAPRTAWTLKFPIRRRWISWAKATSSTATIYPVHNALAATRRGSRRHRPLYCVLSHPANRAVDPLAATLPSRRGMDLSSHRRSSEFTDISGKKYRVGDYLITNGSADRRGSVLVPVAWTQHCRRLSRQSYTLWRIRFATAAPMRRWFVS